MLRHALAEVRLHPGRFVSTILAVAISVAFLVGSAVFVATEGQAQGRALNVGIAGADLVVTATDGGAKGVREAISAVPGVAAVAPVLSFGEAVSTDGGSELLQLLNVPPEPLRWAGLTAGRWPAAAHEVALSTGAAGALKVDVGATLRLAGREERLTVVGLTDEPSAMFAKTGYAADARFAAAGLDLTGTQWSVKLAEDADQAAVLAALEARLDQIDTELRAEPAADLQARAVADMARSFDAFTNVLWAFAAVALVVGMITISNTFTITLAQRRRQIGLLRAVGASGAQVRHRFLAEAVLLGLLGSAVGVAGGVGVAAAASAWTGSMFWGVVLPWPQMLLAFGLGVLATALAAWVPILRGTRVAPLEALQPVLTGEQARRASARRTVTCGLLVLAGAGLAAAALTITTPEGFLLAIGAGALISLGVLLGGPLFVPWLLKGAGRLIRLGGTVPRLAADNAERNPRRATATATALMLAIGLMVTLQVATASIRATVLDQIRNRYPVDVSVAWLSADGEPASIPDDVARRLAVAPGVARSLTLVAGRATLGGDESVELLGYDPAIPLVTGVQRGIAGGEVLVNPDVAERLGDRVTVEGAGGGLELSVVPSDLLGFGEAMVTGDDLAQLSSPVPSARLWLSVPDRSQAVSVIVTVTELVEGRGEVAGGMAEAATYERVLNLLLTITTALLAVAVVIALIGVSNTLGLSVLERTRESALLRALGLQARSLRMMLTVEALQVTGVGVVVGVVAGAGFGWLAVASLARSAAFDTVIYTIDLPQTLTMVLAAVGAAALASVLPGRRAAKAAPTEALADI